MSAARRRMLQCGRIGSVARIGTNGLRLTKKSKYAVRALMELAIDGCGSPMGVYDIARKQNIPERFLEQIFGDLRRAWILESHRGAHGGFCFAVPPDEITVLDIVEILDGEIRPARCSAGGTCYIAEAPLCTTSKIWDEARVALESVFGRYTIAQIVAKERESRTEAADDGSPVEPAATSLAR